MIKKIKRFFFIILIPAGSEIQLVIFSEIYRKHKSYVLGKYSKTANNYLSFLGSIAMLTIAIFRIKIISKNLRLF